MPLYMDIHHGVDGSIDEVHAAHLSDLEAQERFGVRYLRYWFDPTGATVSCLVDAPDPEAASNCHLEAHGLVADKVIEVDKAVVEAFLGDSVDAGTGRMTIGGALPDGGLRTILFTDMVGSTELTQRVGDREAMKVQRAHDELTRRVIEAYGGRVIKHTGDGFMVAFRSASAAIRTAVGTLKGFRVHNERMPDKPIHVRIGMSAGEPVDEGDDLFGGTVQLASRVCDAAGAGAVYVSNVVRELTLGKDFEFRDIGEVELKGFSLPVRLHEVVW